MSCYCPKEKVLIKIIWMKIKRSRLKLWNEDNEFIVIRVTVRLTHKHQHEHLLGVTIKEKGNLIRWRPNPQPLDLSCGALPNEKPPHKLFTSLFTNRLLMSPYFLLI